MRLHGRGIEGEEPERDVSASGSGLRIVVHDFSGHAFPMDLSRALARRGHSVRHVYCESFTCGKGSFDVSPDDGDLSVTALRTARTFAKYSPFRRIAQETEYGRQFAAMADDFRPDVILACNMPLVVQRSAAAWCREHGVPWVFWLQDLYSVAINHTAVGRLGPAGRVVGWGFERIERALLRDAAAVVSITHDFGALLDDWGVPAERRAVIENWAPLAEMPLRPRNNAWRRAQGLDDRFVYLYSGTLGLKHRPELLYELAAQHGHDAEVVVISEGLGEQRLRDMLAAAPLPNLRLLPYQPFEQLPDILAAADVLVGLLEPTAGTFSVPSKVLSYLCAGRPVLAAIPGENLAARTIERAGAGLVVPPTDTEAFLLAAKQLRNDRRLRDVAGSCARAYAEATFDTDDITTRFTEVIAKALGRHPLVGAVR